MKVACKTILKVAFILCCFLQSKLDASMLKEDTFEPAQGITEEYPSPTETAATLVSGFLMNSKKPIGTRLYPKIDLVFILDSSSSVGERNFAKIQQFVRNLVREFKVNPSATQVSVVSYGSNARLEFPLNQYVNIECTIKAIDSLRYIGKKPSLVKALELLSKKVFRKEKGARKNAKKIMFLVTGEQSNSREILFELPDGLFYVIAVGVPYSDPYLLALASSPISKYYLRVKTFDDLVAISEDVKGKGAREVCLGSSEVYDECNRRCKCRNGQLTNCYRIRKEFTAMSLEERTRYINAIKIVSSRQPYQKIYDELTSKHPDYFWKIHVQNFFFPWHRWYILEFENLLRQVDCRVTVPYWNWPRAVKGKLVFRTTHLKDVWYPGKHGLGGNGTLPHLYVADGPFACGSWKESEWLEYPCLKRAFARYPELSDGQYIQGLYKYPREQFLCFEYAVRMILHNDLHNAVGGTMAVDESASAPEFWFHHGFLDKLWFDWQKRGQSFKFQHYKSVKDRMPGNGKIGWSYVDLQNQPGCVKVTYEDSQNFYAKTRDEYPLKKSPDTSEKYRFKSRHFKKATANDEEDFRDDDVDVDDDVDEDHGGDDDDDEDSEEDKRLRKSCNMDSDGNFVINGQKYHSKPQNLKDD